MGKYINKNSKGEYIGTSFRQKIDSLIQDGAEKIEPPKEWEENLCCAVDNYTFGAVAYTYDEREMEVFLRGSGGRPTQWLKVPNAKKLVDSDD